MGDFQKARLGDLVKIKTGKLDANASSKNGEYPFFTCAIEPLRIDSFTYDCECVLVAGNGDLNVKYYEGKFDAYQRTYIIESNNKEKLDTKYLYYFLDKYIETLRAESIGGVIKYIKLGNLTEAKIPLPKLNVQSKIVRHLEKTSQLIFNRMKQMDNLDLLMESQFIQLFGDPLLNPLSLKKFRLKECVEMIENGTSPVCEPAATPEEAFGVLKLSAVTSGKYDDNENKHLTATHMYKFEYEVRPGDLLMTRKNTYELVGKAAYVFDTRKNLMMSDLIFRIKVRNDVLNPIYLWQLINNSSFRCKIRSLAGGTSGSMPNISKSRLMALEIPVPDMYLQNQFADFVQQVEHQKALLQQSLTKMEENYKSLMQKCFRGEIFS